MPQAGLREGRQITSVEAKNIALGDLSGESITI